MSNLDESIELSKKKKFDGILRNVMWEGLSSTQRDFFKDKIHVKLASDVVLVEYKAESSTDLGIFVGALLFVSPVLATVYLACRFLPGGFRPTNLL